MAIASPRIVILSCLFLPAISALASAAAPTTRPATILLQQSHEVEDELATLLEQRGNATLPVSPASDLQIDLRIIANSLLAVPSSPDDMDLMACGWLRARSLLSAASEIRSRLPHNGVLSPAQLDELARLHQMTYRMPQLTSIAQLDELSRQVGSLLLAAGAAPQGTVDSLPVMRPAPIGSDMWQSSGPQTLSQLAAAARQSTVSPSARRQLEALAAAAEAAAADPRESHDAAELYDALRCAVGVARSLQQGGMVDSEARLKIDKDLTDAAALVLDVRTRRSGRTRLQELAPYQRMLDQIRDLNLAPELRDELSPALRWAQRHGPEGPAVLQSIRRYVELLVRHRDRKTDVVLPQSAKRVIEGLEKQFAVGQRQFIVEAARLGDDASPRAGESLRIRLDELDHTDQSIELIEQMPAAVVALAAFKPRPTGGLEKRAHVAVSAVGSIAQSPTANQARQFLQDLQILASVADSITRHTVSAAQIDKLYADDRLSQFNAHRTDLLTDLASQAAAGRELQRSAVQRLQWSQELADALGEATSIEKSIEKNDVLRRWADWDVSGETLNGVLQPYRQAVADAILAFIEDHPSGPDKWTAAREQAEPVLRLLNVVGSYAEQCGRLPGGWMGQAARLMTPTDKQPFALERNGSLALEFLNQMNGDYKSPEAKAVIDGLEARLEGNDRIIAPP